MDTIYVHELRGYAIGTDTIECSWSANGVGGERIFVTGTLGRSPTVLRGLADLLDVWEALGCPKTKLEPLPSVGRGRRLVVTVRDRFVQSVEGLE